MGFGPGDQLIQVMAKWSERAEPFFIEQSLHAAGEADLVAHCPWAQTGQLILRCQQPRKASKSAPATLVATIPRGQNQRELRGFSSIFELPTSVVTAHPFPRVGRIRVRGKLWRTHGRWESQEMVPIWNFPRSCRNRTCTKGHCDTRLKTIRLDWCGLSRFWDRVPIAVPFSERSRFVNPVVPEPRPATNGLAVRAYDKRRLCFALLNVFHKR